MQNKNKLTLHTTICPAEENAPGKANAPKGDNDKTVKPKKTHPVRRPSASERLFRNTAVACALLLTVMAFKNIDTPFTNKITGAVKSVISMDMNLPSSVGNLTFVQKFMPESALVFLNQTNAARPSLPVKGEMIHSYADSQPWVEYKTDSNAAVYSLTDGKVDACVQTEAGDHTLLIKNTDGTECIYALLKSASVSAGDTVKAGTQIGITGANEDALLYFELRLNGAPVDPQAILEK